MATTAKPDKVLVVYGATQDKVHTQSLLAVAPDIDDVIKISHSHNITVRDCSIAGGNEDCIDINNSHGCFISNVLLIPKKNGITIKGGSTKIYLSDVQFLKKGTRREIDIGNWSDQNQKLTELIRLDLPHEWPIRVRVMHGRNISVTSRSNVKITYMNKYLVKLYWLYKSFILRFFPTSR